MLVRLEKDWNYPDIRRQTPKLDGKWGEIVVTEDPVPACDLLVVLNSPCRDIRVRVPPGNKWLFSQESPIEMYSWHKDSFRYFDRVFTFWDHAVAKGIVHDQTALPWHIDKTYPELIELARPGLASPKKDAVSWVTSSATHKPGHQLRMAFKQFLEQERFAFDLFGRGFEPVNDKFDAIHPYKYSIAIENYICNDYWTEKLSDCFLSWTVPIYAGASNILSYFPANSMILIDPSDKAKALRIIRDAIDNDHFGRHLDAISEARRLVLDRYQFFPNIVHQREKFGISVEAPQRIFIPAHKSHFTKDSAVGHVKRAIKSHVGRLLWHLQ